MKEYISKSAIVAELERRMNYWHFKPGQIKSSYAEEEDRDILSFINTLETKGVDFEKEFDSYANGILACDIQFEPFTHLHKCAKYFYELGMAVSNKSQKEE